MATAPTRQDKQQEDEEMRSSSKRVSELPLHFGLRPQQTSCQEQALARNSSMPDLRTLMEDPCYDCYGLKICLHQSVVGLKQTPGIPNLKSSEVIQPV